MYAHHPDRRPAGEATRSEDRPHQIGELAEKFDVTLRTIRFYEEKGLIRPRRVSARTRLYDTDAVARLALIVELRRYGVTVDEIAVLLATRDTRGEKAFEADLAVVLDRRHAELTSAIQEAEALRTGLVGWLADLRRAA